MQIGILGLQKTVLKGRFPFKFPNLAYSDEQPKGQVIKKESTAFLIHIRAYARYPYDVSDHTGQTYINYTCRHGKYPFSATITVFCNPCIYTCILTMYIYIVNQQYTDFHMCTMILYLYVHLNHTWIDLDLSNVTCTEVCVVVDTTLSCCSTFSHEFSHEWTACLLSNTW